ncbi:glycosyltransferase family 4 protein [uncultured Polaribacter sp.]|uniref:glycosyltransferase family 4 protein n=1 Tax=uncultured Polaribacter sp. TaxID=174711 RepID=UPI0026292C93|nr:glycosyltransferase family 4 protein [uncultured Polaribacter sp.]
MNKKKHIIYLTNEYPKEGLDGGGIGSFVQFLGHGLTSKNIKISVIGINNINKDEHEKDKEIDIYRLARSKWKFGKFYQNTQRILSKIEEINKLYKVDIIEGSELNFAFFPKKTTYKKVIRLHGGHHFFAIELGKKPALWRGFQEKRSFNRADNYVAVSNYVGNQTQKHLKINFPFITIYNTVNTNKFKPNLSASIKKNQLLFVGTVCEKKGIRQLVESIAIIKKKINNVHLKIVGRDWVSRDGVSYVSYLKTIIPKELKKNIEFVGAVAHNKVTNYIDEAHLCIFPSHMEAMPIAWLEGLAKGKTVIAANIGPGRELIKDNKTGVLVDPYSPEDIAKKIILLLTNNEKAFFLAKEARIDILDRFSPQKILDKNITFYNSILKN